MNWQVSHQRKFSIECLSWALFYWYLRDEKHLIQFALIWEKFSHAYRRFIRLLQSLIRLVLSNSIFSCSWFEYILSTCLQILLNSQHSWQDSSMSNRIIKIHVNLKPSKHIFMWKFNKKYSENMFWLRYIPILRILLKKKSIYVFSQLFFEENIQIELYVAIFTE